MELEVWQLGLLAVLGVVAGILNVVAGGGTLLTLPVMILMGIPAPTANGTNRVAILAQNLTAITSFKSRGFSDFKLSLTLALAALPGAVAGAWTGTLVRGVVFNRLLAAIMIGVIVLMAVEHVRKSRKAVASAKAPAAAGIEMTKTRLVLGHVCMIGVGFYGGFIQAGVGFLVIAAMHNVMGLDLVRVNMHKVFVIAVYTLAALIVFVMRGHVLWIVGLTLAVGNSVGGWIGAQLSVTKGEGFIRVVLYLALTAMAIKLLWG